MLASLLLAACSSDKPAANPSSEPAPSSEAPAQKGDANKPFVFVAQQDAQTADPAKNNDEVSLAFILNTYDPLVYPKVDEGSMEPGAHVAEDWTISEDGITYTFTIRSGIKFHSGNELTAEDVAYSMKRILALKQGSYWLWSEVLDPSGISVDGNKVIFKLNSPHAPFLASLTQLFIVDSKTVKANQESGEFGENGDYGQKYLESKVAGSGPYLLEGWERGSKMKFKQFTDYWKGWKDNQLKNVEMQIVGEEATVKTMLASGKADMVNKWLSVKTFGDLAKLDGIIVKEDTDSGLFHLPMNTQKAPLDDINVRKAITLAFDYTTATKDILDGATQAAGPVSSVVFGHNDDVKPYARNLELAKEYMAKSKYAGQAMEIEYMFINEFPVHRQIGALLQQNMAEIGITVKMNGSTWANIVEATTKKETTPHMIIVDLGLRYPHVDAHTYGQYHPASWGSYRSSSWYDNKEAADVLEKARTSPNPEDQLKYYKQAQEMVTDDAVSVYISNPTHRIAYRDHVDGYKYVGLLGYDLSFYHLSLK